MNEIDRLKIDRRKLEIEITRLQERINKISEDKKSIDKRIYQLQQTGKEGAEFTSSVFGENAVI